MRRDIEKVAGRKAFIVKLRRLADALERDERFSIQVLGKRIVVPRDATFGVEHEREGGTEELEFQLTWKTPPRRRHGEHP